MRWRRFDAKRRTVPYLKREEGGDGVEGIEKRIGNAKSMVPYRKRAGVKSPSENEGLQR